MQSHLLRTWVFCATVLASVGCAPRLTQPLPPVNPPLPSHFPELGNQQARNPRRWGDFFQDPELSALIRFALTNNQELAILMQEVASQKAEVGARKGALLPFLRLGGKASVGKSGRGTPGGAVEDSLDVLPGRKFPEPVPQFGVATDLDWEVDIWRKLRNERDAAIRRYWASAEGRKFMQTQVVAEIAQTYYELIALDSQLSILRQTVDLQGNLLNAVRLQKQAAKVTELAVRRFESEVLKNRSRIVGVEQQVVLLENHLNQLLGRYPEPIRRRQEGLEFKTFEELSVGVPADLLRNRPDVRQAEWELAAAGLDIKVARARFYPSLNLTAALGLESFSMGSLVTAKESAMYGAAANIAGPLVNRSALQAAFKTASARQVAAVYRYQQTVLKAYVELVNELTRIRNLAQSSALKSSQVATLNDSVSLASQLFNSARADYTEVLLTQRDALESRMELVELRQQQWTALIRAYKALGGGADDATPAGPLGTPAP